VSTPFAQGDGLAYSVAQFDALWVNLGPGLIAGPTKLDANRNNVFTVDFNEVVEQQVSFEWTIRPGTGIQAQN
jgi:hypothetical protein